MRVILTEDIPTLGTIGQIVNVKDGYARNYLLPRSLAVTANETNKKELEHRQRVLEKRRLAVLAEMKQLASKLEKVTLTVAKQVGEDERIFGSVTAAEIATLLTHEGFEVNKKDIALEDEVKKVGVYSARIKLHSEVSAKIKVWVVAQTA